MKRARRGHVLLVVIIVMVVMLLAGAVGLSALTADQRSVGEMRMKQQLMRGAEAGVAHRLSELAAFRDPVEVLDLTRSAATSAWNAYPAPNQFTSATDVAALVQYRTSPARLLRRDGLPPPGVAVGTQTYVFEIDAFSVPTNPGRDGEASLTIGVRMWDAMPSTYGP